MLVDLLLLSQAKRTAEQRLINYPFRHDVCLLPPMYQKVGKNRGMKKCSADGLGAGEVTLTSAVTTVLPAVFASLSI